MQPGELKDKLFIISEEDGGLSDEHITSLRRYDFLPEKPLKIVGKQPKLEGTDGKRKNTAVLTRKVQTPQKPEPIRPESRVWGKHDRDQRYGRERFASIRRSSTTKQQIPEPFSGAAD